MSHTPFLHRCIDLAQRAKGHTSPNPMVGAVLVHQGRIIGEGWHQHYGGRHAEISCLESVLPEHKPLISESTLYVNLEPCAHYGNTPPCAGRIIKEGIKQVVMCNTDPYEQVKGRGIAMLREAGVEVITDLLEQEGRWLNRRFFCYHQQQRPYIVLKWAETRDGYIAPADGSRFHITNEMSARLLHKWRTEEAAIMVGTCTAVNDNPTLTARLWQGRQPLRIVLDRHLKVPHGHHVFNQDAATWIINATKNTLQGNVRHLEMDFDQDLLPKLMGVLHEGRILSLIVEGGAALLHSFIAAGLWDEARIFTGDTMLGSGIAAPLLTHAVPVFETMIMNDRLSVFTHQNTAFPYVQGMEL